MPAAATPPDEAARLAALRAHRVLDSPPEKSFDDLTREATEVCGTPIGLVSLVDAKRQWFKSRLGLSVTETPRDQSICAHALLTPDRPLIVPDISADSRFADNPQVTGDSHLRFYAGIPLRSPEGHALGTLCVLDRVPRQLSSFQIEKLRAIAQRIATLLSVRRIAPTEHAIIVGFGLGLALLVSMAVFAAVEAGRFLASNQWVAHTHEVIQNVQETLLAVEAAESSQRGYTITGQGEFLPSYQAAVAAIPAHLQTLRSRTSDNPVQQRACDALEAAIEAKLAITQDRIDQRRVLRAAALEARYMNGKGRAAMEAVFSVGQGMIAVETRLLREREAARTWGLHAAVAILGGTSAVGALLLALGCWLVRREFRRSHALGGALAHANSGLESEVGERRRAQRRLAVQHAVAHIAAESVSLADAAPRLLESIGSQLGWQLGELWTVDPVAKVMRLTSRWYDTTSVSDDSRHIAEFAGTSQDWTFGKGKGLPGRAWEEGTPAWEHELATNPHFLRTAAARKAGLQRAFAFPLRGAAQGGVEAAIVFLGREGGVPDPELVETMATLAGQVAQFAERCSAESSLRASQTRFSAFIENAPAVAYIKDAQGRMLYGNQTLLRCFDLRLDQWLGKTDADFWPEEALTIRATDQRVLEDERPIETKETIPLPDGSMSHWLSYKFALRDEATGGKLLAGISIDITAREEAEENRRAKKEAVRASQDKSKFLSRVSHELRTPLNAILGFGQLLQLGLHKEQDVEAVGYITKAGKHLLALVDEVLDVSRAESGELQLCCGPVDAHETARECVALVTHLAEKREVTCQVQTADEDLACWCDAQRLRQVLLNLLSNAIKYNRQGGQVVVGFARMDGDRLRLTVRDTGPGIAKHDLGRLFIPFERLESPGGMVEGVGLGLVVSRRMAEAMKGSLGVESQLGQGSTFWVELPLAGGSGGDPLR